MLAARMGTARRRWTGLLALAVAAPLALAVSPGPAYGASSDACEDGGYRLVNSATGEVVASSGEDRFRETVAASDLGAEFDVVGRYTSFRVRTADFAVFDQAFLPTDNPTDMTGGRHTPVFASRIPDHRGLVLSGGVDVRLDEETLRLQRAGDGLAMKIQAKDCTQGGIFQMEPEREDGTPTRYVHTLADTGTEVQPFYFDNPYFREAAGQFLGSACTDPATGPAGQFCVQVRPRVNIANDFSAAFVARDSAQMADRVDQPECNTAGGLTPSLEHCGRMSVWDVQSGGRMGFVTGEDAVEVANPPTACVEDCQAQNQVQGRLAVLGFPFPVPATDRLVPDTAPVPA